MSQYSDFKEGKINCEECGWSGLGKDADLRESFGSGAEYECPRCSHYFGFVAYPIIEETPADREIRLARLRRLDKLKLTSVDQLPELDPIPQSLTWDLVKDPSNNEFRVILNGQKEVWREPCRYGAWERFGEVAQILQQKYGHTLRDLIPSPASYDQLYDWGETWKPIQQVDSIRTLLASGEDIASNPDGAAAFNDRGVERANKGDLDGAIEDYSEAIRLRPDFGLAIYNRGVARQDKKDLDGAIEDYSEAIRLKPDYAGAFYNRGLALQDKDDLDGAIEDYSEAIRLKPDYTAFYYRATAGNGKGDFDGAIKDYSEVIRLRPEDALAFENRGLARQAKGDADGAAKDFDEAKRLKAKAADDKGEEPPNPLDRFTVSEDEMAAWVKSAEEHRRRKDASDNDK